jgi:hypothetical protein
LFLWPPENSTLGNIIDKNIFGAKMSQNSSAIHIVEPQPVIATLSEFPHPIIL